MAQLDPDFRRSVKDTTKPFCVRCRKEIKDTSKAVPVTVNWESWDVVAGHNKITEVKNDKTSNKVIDNGLLGKDCAKNIGL